MGSVSLYEDISDRLTEDAANVAALGRVKLTSLNHLADGVGARSQRPRSDVAALWQDLDRAITALENCNRRALPQDPRKRTKAMIGNVIEGSRLKAEMHVALKKLASAYPPKHPVRVILEKGLRNVS